MPADIVPVPESDKVAMWAMLQEYLAELSTRGGPLPINGAYPYRYFDPYWIEPTRWPFWIVSDGRRAGLAMVRRLDDGTFEMAEFYIRPDARRGGLGATIARKLFARFPGRWHVSEFRENAPAIAFWRRITRDYPDFRETIGERVDQTFRSV